MKKRKIKNYVFFGIFLTLLVLIPLGCEKESIDENIDNSNTLKTENHVSHVNQSQIPNVINAINELTGNTTMKSTLNQKAISYNKTKIKTDKVLKVKNKGFINYTFKVLVENAPSNEFYNLVVTEEDSKNVKKPYILKYVVDNDALPLFKANNQNFQYFKGNRYVVSFDSFFNSKKTNAKSTNVPCPESYIYINNPPSGGGGGSDGGINNVPSTNFLQPVFGYNPTSLTGYFNLWLNSYNTVTNQTTIYSGTVPNSTAVNVTGSVAPISPVTGGSYMSSALISAQPTTFYGGGGETISIIRYYELDGRQEMTTTIQQLEMGEQEYRTENEINECPKILGEIAVITTDTADCDPELQDVYGECIEVDRIINNLTNPCASNIFSELEYGVCAKLTSEQSIILPDYSVLQLNFNEIILGLFNNSDKTHLSIVNNEIGAKNAQTVGTRITLDDSYLNSATKLSIARTIIHETVHAYLNGIYHNLPDLENKSLYEKMTLFAKDNGYNLDDPYQIGRFHHEFMGQFVNAMAYSLFEWDKNYGSGGNLGWNYYYSMGFGGLFYTVEDTNGNTIQVETDSFKVLVSIQSERDKIKQILYNEQENSSNSKGTKCD